MVSWGPWNYRRNLNTVSCGEFTLVDEQKIWSTPHFHNRWIFGILYHQVDIFTIFCDILTIDFSVSLNNTTDPKTEKYTITQVDSKHKTFLTRDCMKGRFMTFYVTILKKKNNFLYFFSQLPCGFDQESCPPIPSREARGSERESDHPITSNEARS